MKIKFLCAVAALALGSASEVAFADDAPTPEVTVTGSAAVVSSYRFRGVAQNDNKFALQAAITVTDKSGFYVSTWGSANSAAGGTAGSEVDVYGGYSKTVAGFALDGGLYGYVYPGASDNSSFEVYGDVSKTIGPVTGKLGVNWAPKQHYFNFYATPTRYSMYEYAELSYTPTSLPALTIHGHIGHTGGGNDIGGAQYMDYLAGVGYKWKNLTFDISGTGTNLNTASSVAAFGSRRWTKGIAVASLTASF